MVGYPFHCEGSDDLVTYRVGNPMGAYSSWASFALAHHYLVFYCCKEVGINWKDLKYSLLGDDILIGNKEIGKMYKSLLPSLGVEFSVNKTHSSPHFYEFAKRIFYKGVEITPFPLTIFEESEKCCALFVSSLLWEKERGWKLGDVSQAIASYMIRVKKYNRSH